MNHPESGNMVLLVIDVQRGLFERSTPVYQSRQLISNINHLVNGARLAGVPVFFIQHSNDNLLQKGSHSWQLHPDFHPRMDEVVIHKKQGNAFEGTNLREELEKCNVSSLVLTGLVTHGCVKATCLGALEEGYRVVLVGDAHSSYSKDAAELIDKWNHALQEKGAEVMETRNVVFISR